MEFLTHAKSGCIIIEDKNGGQGKGYPNSDQTFQAGFNELLFISISLKLNQNFVDSLMVRTRGSNATSPCILRKIHDGWTRKTVSVRNEFLRGVKLHSTKNVVGALFVGCKFH